MTPDFKIRNLLIVDNSDSGWTGLRYLKEWANISRAFDIATGYFEVGSLLGLDGLWQKLEKIRILMGAETTSRTQQIIFDSLKDRTVNTLNSNLEGIKKKSPFLSGVAAIVDALKSGKIECRIYDKGKFHAKAYITHSNLEVIGSQALVGSSNFTAPGLTENIELNIQVQSAREVALLQEWFESHWAESSDITNMVVNTISRHTREYSPFDVYTKALQEFFKSHDLTSNEWEETRSKVFTRLDRYQKEAYWSLIKIARKYGGAFLCDGVGLGKTFVGLMLIERFVLHEGKRVVLLAPKSTKEGVWIPHLLEFLPHIGGVGGRSDFSNLAVFSHTDLGRKGEYPERFKRIAELADVVIIDEAHHFRNPGRKGSDGTAEPSRYYKLYDLLDCSIRPKLLFNLTATPINNRISDFRHLVELFTRRDEQYFSQTLGVNSLRAHFNNLERNLRETLGHEPVDISEELTEAQELLSIDNIFRQLVVQRSRSYAKESQILESGSSAVFPERDPPKVAEYSIRKTFGKLLDLLEEAFQKDNPLFTLAMYYPLHWYKGPDENIDPLEEGRQKQVVGLIRTQFLKRFESSVAAFEMSCDRLFWKLLAFLKVHSETDSEKGILDRWESQNSGIIKYIRENQLELWGEGSVDSDEDDIIPQEMVESIEKLDRNEYDVPAMISETILDLDQIIRFLFETQKFHPNNDDKLLKLIELLKSKELKGQKVLIFTEFADTARYLKKQLSEAGIEGIAQVDSATKENIANVIKRFSPYYNEMTSEKLKEKGMREIRILISTDILSEGLNLQDASRMINYDIHWNPVRLMQRIGRVDRRMNPEIEAKLIDDHPDLASSRGKISFWNFLPPDELNAILTLYSKVTQKTLLISKTLGIEGRQLLTPDDHYEALREFNQAYEGTKTTIENMHLEYQKLLEDNPELEKQLKNLPGSVFSGRKTLENAIRGVFLCFSLPALDKDKNEFTEEAGTTRWYLYDLDREIILEDPGEIVNNIRSEKDTPRHCTIEQEELMNVRDKVRKHIRNTYLRSVNAPVGVEPSLKCWMELNGG